MNLKAAAESGKPFRHKSWPKSDLIPPGSPERMPHIAMDEAISDDWEIQQKETFSREDVEAAIEVAVNEMRTHANGLVAKFEAMKVAESSGDDMTSKESV